jgi:NAD(P)-dependent dehydrogenase (short-subunit alcohol dehydrogenase family)
MLTGKVAVVTGAGSGIGRAVALRIARDGARVVAADLNAQSALATAQEIRALERSALDLRVDVTQVRGLEAMVASTIDSYGRIDILVPCAGIDQQVPMMELTEAEWDRMLAINAKAVFFTLQAVARQMIRQRSGVIVTIASGAGHGPRPSHVHYAASKAAVISITRSAAAALAPHGIRVNAVCPGIIETPMWDPIDRDMFERFGIPLGEYRQSRLNTVPMGRLGTAEDVANLVAFLTSTEASYITGQSYSVNGGAQMD